MNEYKKNSFICQGEVYPLEEKKTAIFNCAKELFATKGYKDTNVADITKMAGIAVGSFYKYYSSKDQLFMELYLSENEQLKRNLMETVNPDDDPVKFMKEILTLNFQGMIANPILKEWYNRDLFSKLEKNFYEQEGFKSISEFMNRGAIELIKKWKADGKLREDLNDELIMAIINSTFYIDFHKKEIGIQYFPQVLDYIVEFVMKGLTDCS
jgi:AcrR family transcriptional regulator